MNTVVDQEPAKRAAMELEKQISKFQNEPLLLMLSGGSALSVLDHLSPELFDDRITITMLDERYSNEKGASNFLALKESSFYKDVSDKGVGFINPRRDAKDSLEEAGKSFSSDIKKWKETNDEGVIIALQGIGEDGHTAGVLPFSNRDEFETLFEGEESAVGYQAQEGSNEFLTRITVTLTFLRQFVDSTIVYAKGVSKKQALTDIVERKYDGKHVMPALVLLEMRDVMLITDQLIHNSE